jgi:hypothetical protein
MCIFHEILSTDSAFGMAPVVVALSSLQKGSSLFAEISSLIAQEPAYPVGAGAAALVAVAKDPYRHLRTLLTFEPDHGHGNCALNALAKDLAQESPRQMCFDQVMPSAAARAVVGASSIEEALRQVAIAGHTHRPAFLDWFRENPSGSGAPRAIRLLEELASEIVAPLPRVPSIDQERMRELPRFEEQRSVGERPLCCDR